MNLVDANVLIYAVNQGDPRHDQCREWLDEALSGTEAVGWAWVVVLAYLRLVTKPGLFERPLEVAEALSVVRAWTAQRPSIFVEPTRRHLDVLAGLLTSTGTGGNLTSDAHLAALALEHDAVIVTFDSDFARYSGVRWTEPGKSLTR